MLKTLQDLYQEHGRDMEILVFDTLGKQQGIVGIRYDKLEKYIVLDLENIQP